MFTHKDIEQRTIFVINCIEERSLRVSSGELLLEETIKDSDKTKTLTKLPFQKILALFIIGHIRITTPLIEKCHHFGVSLIVMKLNLRPVFFWNNAAEANYLLHQHQYLMQKDDISIAKLLIANKVENQIKVLKDTRKKDSITLSAIEFCNNKLEKIRQVSNYEKLMGLEGIVAKVYFAALFQDLEWKARRPRTKCDYMNAILDIGYTILFNYIECFLRMFGFDVYVGVFHRLWFQRKSLVCDIMEPFRCVVDRAVRTSIHKQRISIDDFSCKNGEYVLKREKSQEYYKLFFDILIPYKTIIFQYVQKYYRCFMQESSVNNYPQFIL